MGAAVVDVNKLASNSIYCLKRLALSFGKATWIATTTLLVVVVPLIIEMDREQQLIDLEKEQLNVLTSPGAVAKK